MRQELEKFICIWMGAGLPMTESIHALIRLMKEQVVIQHS